MLCTESFRSHAKSFAVSIVVVVVINFVFMLFDYAGILTSVGESREAINRAFAEGVLTQKDHLLFDSRRGYNQYNDCLIAGMIISRTGNRLKDAVSPRYFVLNKAGVSKVKKATICRALQEAASNGDSPLVRTIYYHRYLLGHRTLFSLLLPHFELDQIRIALKVVCYLLLLLILFLSIKEIRWPRGIESVDRYLCGYIFPVGMLVAALYFAFFYGLEYFSQSLNHGPSEIVLFSFMLYVLYFGLMRASLLSFYVTIGVFATFVAYFEFLTGPALIGFAVLVGIISLEPTRNCGVNQFLGRYFGGASCFVMGMIISFTINIGVAAVVFGSSTIDDFVDRIELRTSNVVVPGKVLMDSQSMADIPDIHQLVTKTLSVIDVVRALYWSLPVLSHGSDVLAMSLVALAAFQFFIFFAVILKYRPQLLETVRISAFFSSLLVLPIWYLIFKNHSFIHSHFMIRPVVWILVGGWIAFFMVIGRPHLKRRHLS